MGELPGRAVGASHIGEFHRVKDLNNFYPSCCTITMEHAHLRAFLFILLRLA